MKATDLARTFDAVTERSSRSADNARLLGAFVMGVAGALALRGLLRARGGPGPPQPAYDMVDEADDESFPASDPPSFTPGHAGSPDHARDNRGKEGGG